MPELRKTNKHKTHEQDMENKRSSTGSTVRRSGGAVRQAPRKRERGRGRTAHYTREEKAALAAFLEKQPGFQATSITAWRGAIEQGTVPEQVSHRTPESLAHHFAWQEQRKGGSGEDGIEDDDDDEGLKMLDLLLDGDEDDEEEEEEEGSRVAKRRSPEKKSEKEAKAESVVASSRETYRMLVAEREHKGRVQAAARAVEAAGAEAAAAEAVRKGKEEARSTAEAAEAAADRRRAAAEAAVEKETADGKAFRDRLAAYGEAMKRRQRNEADEHQHEEEEEEEEHTRAVRAWYAQLMDVVRERDEAREAAAAARQRSAAARTEAQSAAEAAASAQRHLEEAVATHERRQARWRRVLQRLRELEARFRREADLCEALLLGARLETQTPEDKNRR